LDNRSEVNDTMVGKRGDEKRFHRPGDEEEVIKKF
jgi:hypothetical protein